MKSLSLFKNLTWFLSVLLILAPINAAFASTMMSHSDMDKVSFSTIDLNTTHDMMAETETHHHTQSNNMDDNSCKAECANCVFCSATSVISNYITLKFDNTPRYENFKPQLTSIDINVDIRPPISI